MNRSFIILVFVFVSSIAQEATHTVKSGDNLWDIAGFYYQNPFLWPYIWRANLTKIDDPHWIYPDQVFVIPPSPEELVSEAPPESVALPAPAAPPEAIALPAPTAPPEYVPEITPTPPSQPPAAEVISVVKAEERIFTEELIHRAGFIIKEDMPYWGKIIGTEPSGEKNITTYKKVYIDRAAEVKKGDVLTIYRPGKVITHPQTGKTLGKEITILGKVEVEEIGPEGSRCKVMASYEIIRNGDLATPYEPILAPENVSLVPTTKELEGYVVEVKSLGELTPSNTFVLIDQGEEAGICVGDVFDIYQERRIGDRRMPDFNIAQVQIVSIFEDVSVGILSQKRETPIVKRGERCRLAMEAR